MATVVTHVRSYALMLALLCATAASAALPGVTELRESPEEIADAELSALLHARVAEADVVAIGESVHGSSLFLRMQARLVRYLVENHRMRLVVWENAVLRSLELSRWVASCTKAKMPAPVEVLYMPTASDHVLFDWLCEYNRAHPADPVVFRGMDVWDRPWEHYARVAAWSRSLGITSPPLEACPAYRAGSWADMEAIYHALQRDGTFRPEADYQRCRAALTAIMDAARRAGAHKRAAREQGADDAFELAISASTLLGWLGFYHYNWSDDVLSWNERDRAQGRNLMLLMEKHGASRAILSAHTSHVSHNRSPADWWGYGDLKSGVFFYSAMTGRKVFNIALTAYEASGTQGEWMLPNAANSVDRKLHDAGHAFSFFFSDAPFLEEHPRWWIQNGNAVGSENGVELVLRDHFDALFFFGQSLLDKALPARPIWEP